MFNLSKRSCPCCDHLNVLALHRNSKCKVNKITLSLVLFILTAFCTLASMASAASASASPPSTGSSFVRRPRFHPNIISSNNVNDSSTTASSIVPLVENSPSSPLSEEASGSSSSLSSSSASSLIPSARSLAPTQPLASASTGIHRCSGHWRFPSGCRGSSCQYLAQWKYNHERDQVDFTVSTNRPDKWVGIGFSRDMKMPASDAIIAWVEPGSRYVMMDAWIDSYGSPIADAKQSISNISAAAANGLISFFFSRPTNTGDSLHDVNLDECFHLIFPVSGGSVDIKSRTVMKHERTPTVTPQRFCLSTCHAKKPQSNTSTSTSSTSTSSTSSRLNNSNNTSNSLPKGETEKVTATSTSSSSSSSASELANSHKNGATGESTSPSLGLNSQAATVTNSQDNQRVRESQGSGPTGQSISSTVTTSTSVTSSGHKEHSIDRETGPVYKAPYTTTTTSSIVTSVDSNNNQDTDHGSSSTGQGVTSSSSTPSVTNLHQSSAGPSSDNKRKSVTGTRGEGQSGNKEAIGGHPAVGDGESGEVDSEPITSCKGEWKYPSRCTGYGCDYKATWEYLEEEDEIKFVISTKNKNKWTGIAFSSDKAMPSTDAVIGLVEDSGRFFLMDTWLRSYAAPSLDPVQNIQNMSVSRENGVTSLRFHRKRKTGDKNDFQFSDTNCPYFQFPVQGGVFNAVNKRLRKHEAVPIVSTSRICVKSCNKLSTPSTLPQGTTTITTSPDGTKISTTTASSVSMSTSTSAIVSTSSKSSVSPIGLAVDANHVKASHESPRHPAPTTSISSSTSSSSSSSSSTSSSSSSSSSSSPGKGINLKDWDFSQLGPSVVDLSKLPGSPAIPNIKSIPDLTNLTSLLNQMNVSSGGNLPSILRTLANKIPNSSDASSSSTGSANGGGSNSGSGSELNVPSLPSSSNKSNSLPTFTSSNSDTHTQPSISSSSPTDSSSDSVSPSTIATITSSTPTGVPQSTLTTTKAPTGFRKVTPKTAKIPDRWTTLRTTTSTSTIASISATNGADDETTDEMDGSSDDENDDDDLPPGKGGKKKITNSILDSNIKIQESKYEVELKLPKAWKASFARRQSEEFLSFKEKIEQQLKQELAPQFSSLDVQVMDLTGVQESGKSSSRSPSHPQVTTASTSSISTASSPLSPVASSSSPGESSLIAKVRLSVKATTTATNSLNGGHRHSSTVESGSKQQAVSPSSLDQVPREVKDSSLKNSPITSSSLGELTPVKITEALNLAIRDGRIGDVAVDSSYLIVRSIEPVPSDAGQPYLTDEQLKWTVIISGVAALVALVLMQAGFMIWRDKRNRSSFTSNSGKDSSASLAINGHHSYHGYNLSHPNLHGHLYDDIHRSHFAEGPTGRPRNGKGPGGKDAPRGLNSSDRDYLGEHHPHYYHNHHLSQSELNHTSHHHPHHHSSSHHTSNGNTGGGGGHGHHNHNRNHNNNSGNSSGGSSSSNNQTDHRAAGTRHPQSHKLTSLNAMQPDFYFLRHQRRYSGNLL